MMRRGLSLMLLFVVVLGCHSGPDSEGGTPSRHPYDVSSLREVRDILALEDGRLVACGLWAARDSARGTGIVAFEPDGSPDQRFAAALLASEQTGYCTRLHRAGPNALIAEGAFYGRDRSTSSRMKLDLLGNVDAEFFETFKTTGDDGAAFLFGRLGEIYRADQTGIDQIDPDGHVADRMVSFPDDGRYAFGYTANFGVMGWGMPAHREVMRIYRRGNKPQILKHPEGRFGLLGRPAEVNGTHLLWFESMHGKFCGEYYPTFDCIGSYVRFASIGLVQWAPGTDAVEWFRLSACLTEDRVDDFVVVDGSVIGVGPISVRDEAGDCRVVHLWKVDGGELDPEFAQDAIGRLLPAPSSSASRMSLAYANKRLWIATRSKVVHVEL